MVSYNRELRQRYIHAAEAYAKKVKAEVGFFKDVRKHFYSLSRNIFRAYARSGTIPDFNFHEDFIEDLIEKHYLKVAPSFASTLRDGVGIPLNNDTINQSISNLIGARSVSRADISAFEISTTTRAQVEKAFKRAAENAALQGRTLTQKETAQVAQRIFNQKVPGRTFTISVTETQFAAEDAKNIELDVMRGTNAEFDDGTRINDYRQIKMWVAVLDEKTRDDHADADGQEQEIDKPFIVGGEELMYPGDDSLGASEGNVINCRCSSEIVLV